MAGIVSTFSFGDNKTTHSEGLEFTFDLEGDDSDVVYTSNIHSENFRFALSGDFEFVKQRNTRYWRFLATFALICAVLSIGIFSISNNYHQYIAASLYHAEFEDIEAAPIEEPLITDIASLLSTPIDIIEEDELPIRENEEPSIEAFTEIKKEKEKRINSKLKQEVTSPKVAKTEELPENLSIEPAKILSYKTKNLAKARSLSSKTGRYTFIKFGADWCVPCKMMESTALKNKTVVDLLNDKFVVLDVDVDKKRGAKIKEKFYVNKLPTIIILDELGNEVKRKEGGVGTISMIEMLESVAPYIYLEEEITVWNNDGEKVRGR